MSLSLPLLERMKDAPPEVAIAAWDETSAREQALARRSAQELCGHAPLSVFKHIIATSKRTTQLVLCGFYLAVLADKLPGGAMSYVCRAYDIRVPYISCDNAYVAKMSRHTPLGPKDERVREKVVANEAEILSHIPAHPNVADAVCFGNLAHNKILITKYGGKPATAVAPVRPPHRIYGIALQLAHALAHVHAHGVVHSDVKPGNVLIDDEDRVVLIDFGLAHRGGRRGGTPGYLAPEAHVGGWIGETTPASDVWAYGVTVYYILTKRHLMPKSGDEKYEKALQGFVRAPATHITGMDEFFAMTLAREPAARRSWQDIQNFLVTLYQEEAIIEV